MTQTKTEQQTTNESQTIQLPALIKKAQTQLSEFLKNGAHVLCGLEVTDPPPGFYPKVVCVHVNPDPSAKEVYVKEAGWGNKPAQLELSKIALMKLADTLGISWDNRLSGRVDDGRNPAECRYKAVGYIEDYMGKRRDISAEKTVNLDAIRDKLIHQKGQIAEAYQKKFASGDERDIPFKWKAALKENRVAELIASEVKAELIQKRSFMVELAETGAKLRAIRDKGIRTTYTAEELKKPFVDVRICQLPGYNRHEAEQAYNHLYGQPQRQEEAPQPTRNHAPEDTVIDVQATRQESQEEAHDHGGNLFTGGGGDSSESMFADFENCDRDQKVLAIKQMAAKKAFPLPKGFEGWADEKMGPFFRMLIEMPAAGGAK